jgi:hypothetical protein
VTQIRAVIRAIHKPTIDRLMAVTGAATTTDLIDIYITRYSTHLESTWQVVGMESQPISMTLPPVIAQFTPTDPIKF